MDLFADTTDTTDSPQPPLLQGGAYSVTPNETSELPYQPIDFSLWTPSAPTAPSAPTSRVATRPTPAQQSYQDYLQARRQYLALKRQA